LPRIHLAVLSAGLALAGCARLGPADSYGGTPFASGLDPVSEQAAYERARPTFEQFCAQAVIQWRAPMLRRRR
jgi:hypothetical protein